MTHSFNEIKDKFSEQMQDKEYVDNLLSNVRYEGDLSSYEFLDILSNLSPVYVQDLMKEDTRFGIQLLKRVGIQIYYLGQEGKISMVRICIKDDSVIISLSDVEVDAERLFEVKDNE